MGSVSDAAAAADDADNCNIVVGGSWRLVDRLKAYEIHQLHWKKQQKKKK